MYKIRPSRASRPLIFAVLILATLCVVPALAVDVDPAIAPYKRTAGVSGNLNSVGSDTMNNLMTLWAESFREAYPSVRIQIEGKGSSSATPALIEGTAQLGPMSRAMKNDEIDVFEKKFGYKPTVFRVAVDALAVYVHKDNPLKGLTIAQVDSLFSRTRKCGAASDVATWGQLGLTGEWAERPVSLYGRNSASGTYGYFKDVALCKGDFRNSVKEQPGSAAVVSGVAEDRWGIGYSGIGYSTSGVRPLPLSQAKGEPFVSTEPENVYSGHYPMSRYLYIYVNKAPNTPLDPLVGEFLRFVVSREGQIVVVKDGYLPVKASVATEEMAKLR